MSDQLGHSATSLPAGQVTRAWSAVSRGLKEMAARLSASRWLIVVVAVIMVALIAATDLPATVAFMGFLAFVASVALLPRYETDLAGERLAYPAAAGRAASAMHVMSEALPDPIILLNASGQVLSCNAPARSLFGSLREGNHISSMIRTPEFLDAVGAAPQRGRAVTVTYAERVPVGRRMAATVAPITSGPDLGSNILVLSLIHI